MIRGQGAITFGQWCLADVIASEPVGLARSRKRSESFARVDLARRSDRFDARGTTHVRAAITAIAGDGIVEFVNRPGVQRDAQIQSAAQTLLFPSCRCDEMGKLERELTRKIDVEKNKIKSVAPRIPGDDAGSKFSEQLRDCAKKILDEPRHFVLGQFAETDRVRKKDGDDARSECIRFASFGGRRAVGA